MDMDMDMAVDGNMGIGMGMGMVRLPLPWRLAGAEAWGSAVVQSVVHPSSRCHCAATRAADGAAILKGVAAIEPAGDGNPLVAVGDGDEFSVWILGCVGVCCGQDEHPEPAVHGPGTMAHAWPVPSAGPGRSQLLACFGGQHQRETKGRKMEGRRTRDDGLETRDQR